MSVGVIVCVEAGRKGGGWQHEEQYEKLFAVETDVCLNLTILTTEISPEEKYKASLARWGGGNDVVSLIFIEYFLCPSSVFGT